MNVLRYTQSMSSDAAASTNAEGKKLGDKYDQALQGGQE